VTGERLAAGPRKTVAQVAISFNKRTYRFDCSDAEADRLEKVANYFKSKLDSLAREHGPIGDERLVLMAGLMLTDELLEARADIDELLEQDADKLKTFSETVKEMRGLAGSDPVAGENRKSGS